MTLILPFPHRTCFPLNADEFLETYTPLPSKPEPSDYPAPVAFDIEVDRKSKFPVLLLAKANSNNSLGDDPRRLTSMIVNSRFMMCELQWWKDSASLSQFGAWSFGLVCH